MTPTEGRLAPGTTIAQRYVVERLLGTGGLAEVYLVRHVELGSEHALKLLTWNHNQLDERLLLEGRIQAQLTHPNIVRVSDVVRHEGQAALVMELVHGRSLEELSTPLPPPEALALFGQVLGAVAHAHQAGVLHRDLKPANVLLARFPGGWVPKVTDFGLAKVLDDVGRASTRTGISMGTPGYMAPEQVRDSASADRRTDVFALGCLLFELLSGRKAYEPTEPSSGQVEVTATIERRPPPLAEVAPEVPAHVAAAVDRALALDRNDRFDDVRAFAHALGIGDHPALRAVPGVTALPLALANPSDPQVGAFPPAQSTTAPEPPPAGVPGPRVVALLLGIVILSVGVTALLSRPVIDHTEQRRALRQATTLELDAAVPEASGVDAEVQLDPARDLPAPAATKPDPRPAAPVVVPDTPAVPVPDPIDAMPAAPRVVDEVEPAGQADLMEEGEPHASSVFTPASAPGAASLAVPAGAGTAARPPLPLGLWTGEASGQRFTLDVRRAASDRIEATARVLAGTGYRVFALSGTLDPATGAVVLTDGSTTFTGTWEGGRLAGTYGRGDRQTQRWMARPP